MEHEDEFSVEECFDMSYQMEQHVNPLNFRVLRQEQNRDQYIQRLKRQAPESLSTTFEDIGLRGGASAVYTIHDKRTNRALILVPESLKAKLIKWYHVHLIHPGTERLYNTLRQHFVFPQMREKITQELKHCEACQKGKRGLRGHGEIPLKDVERGPWTDMAVDLSGPWTAKVDGKKVIFHALTIVDPFTQWCEIIPVRGKPGEHIRDLIEQEWLRRYPRPERIIFDAGTEFENQWMRMLTKRWHIKCEPITVRTPRANAIVERMHFVMGNMIRCQYSGCTALHGICTAHRTH